MTKKHDVIILGSGPAGSTAAIYTSRASLDTLVIAGNPPGGQLTTTTEVENFPGFPEGIQGPELVQNMRLQAERFGSKYLDENALSVKGCEHKGFCVTTETNDVYEAKTIIVATGASARWLNLPSEQKLRGRGVSACATCDAFFFKGKDVAIVGGGDASMEEALFLTKFCPKVYLIARGNVGELRASKIMLDRALSNDKIEFLYNSEVREVLGENSVEGLKLFNTKTNSESNLLVQGLFVAIGHAPNTKFLEELLELEKGGYAHADNNTFSSIEGIFIAGDVYDYKYRQAITAAGYGCMAALDAEKYIAKNFEHSTNVDKTTKQD